jgi:protein phosphatase
MPEPHLESTNPAAALPDVPLTSSPVNSPASIRLAVSVLSDVGRVRTNNEDACGYDEPHGIYVVCDGMGGMASGEVASAMAVTTILETFARSAPSTVPVSARLLQAITTANTDVWEKGQVGVNKGMGTTAVVAARDGERLIVGNVGDSRAYILQDDQCIQLTVDHSYLNELIRNGTIKIEDAQHVDLQGMESVITRAVGVSADIEPDFFSIELKPGSAILLATDGLTRYLLQDEIASILRASTMETACANLISVAKQRGGQDNITCLLLVALPA